MAYQFKGYKILTKEQHKELLEKGYYTLSDGTQVEQDNSYLYASEETVDLEELSATVEEHSQQLSDLNTALERANSALDTILGV